MNERDDNRLARWLDAEQNGADDEADGLFGLIAASHLHRFDAPVGLTDRILAALPSQLVISKRPVFDLAAPWWARITALTAVTVLGVAMALVSPRHLLDLATYAVWASAHAIADVGASLSAALGVWRASLELIGTLGRTAGLLATTGFTMLLIAANLAIACGAFAGLRRLLAPQEECA